jgi:glycosyltransferase involved in cell wall biosynthesis
MLALDRAGVAPPASECGAKSEAHRKRTVSRVRHAGPWRPAGVAPRPRWFAFRRVAFEPGKAVTDPRVSICIPAWRTDHRFHAALGSVLEQEFADFEIVVSDDSGELATVVEEFDDSRIRYFRNPRPLRYAQNSAAAFDRARGELLGWLHDDDRLLPGFLGTVVSLFDDDAGLGVAFTACYLQDDSGRIRVQRWPVRPGRHSHFLPQLMRHRPVLPSTALVRADLWREARNPWPSELATADMVLWARAAAGEHAFFYVERPLAVYGVHKGQFTAGEERFREHSIRLYEFLEFENPEYERLRREQLAYELLLRSALALRRGDVAAARRDVERAEQLASELFRLRRVVTAWLAHHPRIASRVIHAWRRTYSVRDRLRRIRYVVERARRPSRFPARATAASFASARRPSAPPRRDR